MSFPHNNNKNDHTAPPRKDPRQQQQLRRPLHRPVHDDRTAAAAPPSSNVVPYKKRQQQQLRRRYAIIAEEKEYGHGRPRRPQQQPRHRYLSSLRRIPEQDKPPRRCLEVFMSRGAVNRRYMAALYDPEYDDAECLRIVQVDFPVLLADCKTSGLDVLLASPDGDVTYVFAAMDAPTEEVRERLDDVWKL